MMKKFQGSPDRKALSTLCNNSNIPVSPTANLKLLTKVASELVSPVHTVKSVARMVHSKETDPRTRKDKSLGILCDRFLAMFPLNLPAGSPVMEICLDRVAEQLGIVKRRIYDIINILESLHMASKIAKNRYHWHGCNNLPATLSQLKAMALESRIDEKLQDVQAKQKSGFRLVSGPTCCCLKDASSNSNIGSANSDEKPASPEGFFSDERTLGVMCLKFIMLFLASPQSSARINLDLATRMLVSEAADTSERELWGMKVECHRSFNEKACEIGSKTCKCMLRLKTKVRRLYDIANVLTSLGLITKIETSTNSMRKPVFAYTGPVVRITPGQSTQSFSFKNLVTSASFEEDEGAENKINFCLKRKDKKLKGGPPEKFPRISSDHNLEISNRQWAPSSNISARHVSSHSQYQCSLDDILQVAGQELEKIRSSEELAAAEKMSSARKKLSFARCHSDSCIQTPVLPEAAALKISEPKFCVNAIGNEGIPSTEAKKSVCITLSDSKTKRFTVTRKLVELPVHAIPRKFKKESSFNLSNITPMQAQTLSTLFGLPNHQAQSKGLKQAKASHLSSTQDDVVNNNKSLVQPVSNIKVCSMNRGVLSSIGTIASPVAPGELYRAIKVGPVVHLVPYIAIANCNEKK